MTCFLSLISRQGKFRCRKVTGDGRMLTPRSKQHDGELVKKIVNGELVKRFATSSRLGFSPCQSVGETYIKKNGVSKFPSQSS